MVTVYVHLDGLETALMEVEELPKPTDTCILGRNIRRRDGKDIPYLLADVTTAIFPMSVIKFIEVIPSGEEEEIETFIRE